MTNKAIPPAFEPIWQSAGVVLNKTSNLLVIGYSLPLYDLAVRELLKLNLPTTARIHVFDPCIERLPVLLG